MTLRLILTRHAKSDWSQPGQDDFDRPLNHRGRRDAPRLGAWLASRGYHPDLALCSAAARTRETFYLLAPAFAVEPPLTLSADLYLAEPGRIRDILAGAGTAATVMVIGHNPGIGSLARWLVHDRPLHARFDDFPTAATAVIDFAIPDWSETGPGKGAIRDFITPDDLE